MGVDNCSYRLVGDGFDLIEDRLPPARKLRVHYHNTAVCNQGSCVSTASSDHVKVVSNLFDLGNIRPTLPSRRLRGHKRHREHADNKKQN